MKFGFSICLWNVLAFGKICSEKSLKSLALQFKATQNRIGKWCLKSQKHKKHLWGCEGLGAMENASTKCWKCIKINFSKIKKMTFFWKKWCDNNELRYLKSDLRWNSNTWYFQYTQRTYLRKKSRKIHEGVKF